MQKRIEALDWLRGLMAIAIMFYHLRLWFFSYENAGSIIGKLGIYGVSIFFILSGLSIAIAYDNKISTIKSSLIFYLRRIIRIWPLFWVCLFFKILPNLIFKFPVDTKLLFLNMTTLFGFTHPNKYLLVGAWSIGNEIVYYSLTPLFLFLYNKNKKFGNLLTFTTFIFFICFSQFFLNSMPLENQWNIYIHPLNNLFFYAIGIAIYYNFSEHQISSKITNSILLFSALLFIIIPISGNRINLVIGVNRLIFSFLCITFVFSLYKFSQYDLIPGNISFVLQNFGSATYGIYLIHPIMFFYINLIFSVIHFNQQIILFILCVLLTIVFSLFSYYKFELPLMKYGKKIVKT